MWHEARANEKRIKELMVDHKKRAERRRAYYESRLGDPRQLLRVIGSSCKLYPDAEQYYYHENTDNLMPWPVDPDIRIDRFDGRSLLDYIPGPYSNREFTTKQDKDIQDELNFERYHDLVEMERLQVEEKQRLTEVETEWTKLLDRHKALLAMLNNSGRPKTQNFHTFDYGTNDPNDNMDHEQESQLLKEADILQYVDDLTDKDRSILNDMAEKYGIQNYGRLLRMAKKDRDDDLRELQAKQGKSKERSGRRSRDASKERRRYRSDRDSPRHDDRYYRSKDTRDESSDSDASVEDNPVQSDVVIEFSSTPTEKQESDVDKPKRVPGAPSTASNSTKDSRSATRSEPPKKLTPMEKLKLKMRQGLEKQIHSEEREKRWREREQQLDKIRSTYKKDSASAKHERESSPTPKKTRRYYSPSSSSSGSRSPSPPPSKKSSDRRHRSRSRSYSPRRKSSSHRRQRYRSRSRSRDSKRSRKRSRDSRSRERYSSSRKRRYSPDDRSSSRRSSRDSRR